MSVRQEKWDELFNRMDQLKLCENDLRERFILGSGSGGQKINKTNSCVHLRHLPTGLEVRCQKTRFRSDNRYHARVRLCDKFEDLLFEKNSKKQQAIAKIRRQKQRRSRRSKEKMLIEKRKHGEKKALRRQVSDD